MVNASVPVVVPTWPSIVLPFRTSTSDSPVCESTSPEAVPLPPVMRQRIGDRRAVGALDRGERRREVARGMRRGEKRSRSGNVVVQRRRRQMRLAQRQRGPAPVAVIVGPSSVIVSCLPRSRLAVWKSPSLSVIVAVRFTIPAVRLMPSPVSGLLAID